MRATAGGMDWHIGTMGFGYADWAGTFYPAKTRSGEYLAYYARHFDAVELDTTFYAAPDAQRVRRWAAATPDDFRFCLKTPKSITHEGALDQHIDAMRRFLDVVRGFGSKLGAVLIQFPPSFTAARYGKLEIFLRALPRDLRFAVELRDRSWGTLATLELLQAIGAALVEAEYLSRPGGLIATADFLYVRWVGQHDRFEKRDREQTDVSEGLRWWEQQLRTTGGVRAVYGFFNNDYSGYAIATARRFKEMLGLPATKHSADQGTLFG